MTEWLQDWVGQQLLFTLSISITGQEHLYPWRFEDLFWETKLVCLFKIQEKWALQCPHLDHKHCASISPPHVCITRYKATNAHMISPNWSVPPELPLVLGVSSVLWSNLPREPSLYLELTMPWTNCVLVTVLQNSSLSTYIYYVTTFHNPHFYIPVHVLTSLQTYACEFYLWTYVIS